MAGPSIAAGSNHARLPPRRIRFLPACCRTQQGSTARDRKSCPVGSVIFSFLDNWRALGHVMAYLVGLNADKLDEEEIQSTEGSAKIDSRASEIDLIRLLFKPERNRILDAATS